MGWSVWNEFRGKNVAKSPPSGRQPQNKATAMKVGITNNNRDDPHEHPLESTATTDSPMPLPSAFTLHSPHNFDPTVQSVWEMDDDAFLKALSGSDHAFISTDLPADVTGAEISKFHEKYFSRFSKHHHDDHEDEDESYACTRSMSMSTADSKSMSEISYEDEEEKTEGEDEEPSYTRSINHDVGDCRDDNISSQLYYDVQVPITSDGLLIMLLFNSAQDAVVFEGYAKDPDGSSGPAEQLNVFRNKGDIIVSIEEHTITGQSFQRTLELLKNLMSAKTITHSLQDLQEGDNDDDNVTTKSSTTRTSITPTIRFRVIDCAPTAKLLNV